MTMHNVRSRKKTPATPTLPKPETQAPPRETDDSAARERRASVAAAGPLYRQVVQVLQDEIVNGVHAVDSQLPTEDALRRRFKVSRHTIREALRALRDVGLVESRQGFGTTVLRAGAPRPYVHEVASISALIQLANATHYEIAKSELVLADAAQAGRIGATPGSKWLRIEGYRYTPDDRRPVCWTEVYVHGDFAGVARLLGRRPGPIYLLIEDLYGQGVAEVEQTIHSSQAPDHVAARLGVKAGSAVIAVRRVYRMPSGGTSIVAENLYPVDRFQLSMTLRRSSL
jgi:DNA-binding GntR family transcriptional regulator